MDDIKVFVKNEKELEALINAVRIYSEDIGIKFSIEKYAMLIMKIRKQHMKDGMELPNQEKIRKLGEKKTYKYLSILEADTIKQRKKINFSGEQESSTKQNYITGTL